MIALCMLDRRQPAWAHPDALRAHRQRSCDLRAMSNSARRQHGQVSCHLHDLRNEHHRADGTGMCAGFRPLRHDEVQTDIPVSNEVVRAADQGADDLAGGFQARDGIGRQTDAECDEFDIRFQQGLQLAFEIVRGPQNRV